MPLKNNGNKAERNTLTAARKELVADDLCLIGDLTKFLEVMIASHPEEVVEHFFGAWMRATCIEVDEGKRKGSSTQAMLNHYAVMAESLRNRVVFAQLEEKAR